MSTRYLGEHFDLHTGGIDHISVHHTNEIAQSENALGVRPWVNYWMHGAFLNIDHEKMSKSVGNFFTAREVLDQLDPVQGPEQLRYLFMHAHYRSALDYTRESVTETGTSLPIPKLFAESKTTARSCSATAMRRVGSSLHRP